MRGRVRRGSRTTDGQPGRADGRATHNAAAAGAGSLVGASAWRSYPTVAVTSSSAAPLVAGGDSAERGGFVDLPLDLSRVPAADSAAEPSGFVVETDDGTRIHFLDWGGPTQ